MLAIALKDKVFQHFRWRIAVPYILLTLILMVGLGAYLSYNLRQMELQDLETELTTEARLLSDILGDEMATLSSDDQLDQAAKRWSTILNKRVTLIDANGIVIGESHEELATLDNHLDRPEIQQALSTGLGINVRFSQTLGQRLMYVAVPVAKEGQLVGFARVALPTAQIQSKLAVVIRTILVSSIIAAGLAILIAAVIAEYTSRPIRQLTEAVQTLSLEDQTLKPLRLTKDEIGQLAQAFNAMSSQLHIQYEELETERTKLRAVLDQLTDGVLIVDQEGDVQLINPAAQRMFAVQGNDAMGASLAKVVRQHQLFDLYWLSKKTDESQVSTLELPAQRLYIQALAIPLENVLPGSILMVLQDITQLRHLETVRRDFISNISHELRTPLASIKALAETLQDGALEDPSAARRFLSQMEIEVDALALMVQELLELSRIESGKVPLQLKEVRPIELLVTAEERLHLQAERAGLNLEIQASPDLPLVLADPPRMVQVIVNLLHNAIKFTPSGGRVTLSAVQRNESVVFSVADTGVGISTDDLPRIFERFYKADRARSGGGTGLGLAISRHLVEAHSGQIWALSEEGRGSNFFFSLPISR